MEETASVALTCSFSLGEHLQTVIKQFSFVSLILLSSLNLHLGNKLTNYETQKNAGSVAEGNFLPQILMDFELMEPFWC